MGCDNSPGWKIFFEQKKNSKLFWATKLYANSFQGIWFYKHKSSLLTLSLGQLSRVLSYMNEK